MSVEATKYVDSLAKQIRMIYCNEVRAHSERRTGRPSNFGYESIPRLDGGTDGRGCRHKGVWHKLANFSLRNQLNVRDWIRAVFENALGNAHPSCNQLTTPAAIELARGYRKQTLEETRESFLRQQDKINAEIRRLQLRASQPSLALSRPGLVITDPDKILQLGILVDDASVTPLFRYCVARQKGQQALAANLYQEAMAQYLARRDIYEEVFGGSIPEDFKTTALSLYRAALGKSET